MELNDYLQVLRKNVLWILALALLGVGAGAIVTAVQEPVYRAQTQVFVSTQGGDSSAELVQGNSFTLSRVMTYARLATSQEVLQRVIDDLDLNTTAMLLEDEVSASPVVDTTIIEILAHDRDPEAAALLADAIAARLTDTVAEIETSGDGISPVQLTTIESAVVPETPVSPRPLLTISLGGILALALGIGLALLRELIDTRIRDERSLAALTDLPLVGSIPFDPKSKQRPLVVHSDPQSPRAESFRTLRTNLQFVEVDGKGRSFVVTSSMPSEGKSTTAANLALALADAGETVVLVDADLRKPKVAEYLGIDGSVGLTDLLIGHVELVDAVQLWGDTTLYLLPSGLRPPNPSELLGSKAMSKLIERLGKEFDWVIFDAPPLLPVTDAAVLARVTSGALMVVASGKTTGHQVEAALSLLENADARVGGLALTMVPANVSSYSYGAYGYGYDAESRKRKREKSV